MKYLIFLFSLILPWFQYNAVYGQNERYNLKELMNYLNTDDAHARVIAFNYFNKTVPDESKAAVFAEIWKVIEREKNREAIINSIVNYYITYPERETVWSKEMTNHIISLSKDKDPLMRRLTLNALSAREKNEEVRRTILFFLDDDDPLIRELALVQVSKWKDGKRILKDFIKKNRRKEEMEESLLKARFLLKKMDN